MNRREFIKNTALATAVISAMPYIKADSPSKKYKTALVGCGWWGNNILGEAIASGECKIVALCDVDQRFLKSTEERVKDLTGDTPKTYGDYRELLEKEKPESRKIFVRRYFFGSDVKEIADFYGIGESKVKMSLARSRERLKVCLEEEGVTV